MIIFTWDNAQVSTALVTGACSSQAQISSMKIEEVTKFNIS